MPLPFLPGVLSGHHQHPWWPWKSRPQLQGLPSGVGGGMGLMLDFPSKGYCGLVCVFLTHQAYKGQVQSSAVASQRLLGNAFYPSPANLCPVLNTQLTKHCQVWLSLKEDFLSIWQTVS